jgi:hypothetical protein
MENERKIVKSVLMTFNIIQLASEIGAGCWKKISKRAKNLFRTAKIFFPRIQDYPSLKRHTGLARVKITVKEFTPFVMLAVDLVGHVSGRKEKVQ